MIQVNHRHMSINSDIQLGRTMTWLQRHCSPLLTGLSMPYGLAVHVKEKFYAFGWLKPQRLPCPVISVGNLTVGGTGKTPLVMWLSRWLRDRGLRVGILSRGYRRTSHEERLLVSDGETCFVGSAEAGDEPYLMAKSCSGVVVAVGKNRYDVGRWVFDRIKIDCFVLDDGFQHRRLHRDCDLLVVDALDRKGLQGLLPRGRLREPVHAARRATAILITRVDQVPNPLDVFEYVQEKSQRDFPPIFVRFNCDSVRHVKTGEWHSHEWIAGKRIMLVCGIGNVMSFRHTVESLGAKVVGVLEFPDHVSYTGEHVNRIRALFLRENAELVLTTEKDGVKLASLMDERDAWWAVALTTNFQEGEEHVEHLLTGLPLNIQVRS